MTERTLEERVADLEEEMARHIGIFLEFHGTIEKAGKSAEASNYGKIEAELEVEK